MLTPLNELNKKFSNLENEVKNGKILSTSLKAESPNLAKLIILSVVTFGIYYGVYKYQHNPGRVFTKITSEIKKALNDFKIKQERLEDLSESVKKRLEIENALLSKILKGIEANDKDFVDQIFLSKPTHKLGDLELNLAFKLLKKLLNEKLSPDQASQSLYNNFVNNLKEKKRTSEENIFYEQLQKKKSDDIDLKVDFKEKKIIGRLTFNLTKENMETEIDLVESIDMPSITNNEIRKEVEKIMLYNNNIINYNDNEYIIDPKNNEKINNEKIKEEFSENIEEQKKNLDEIFNHASVLITEIWKNNKKENNLIKRTEIVNLYNMKLQFIKKLSGLNPILNPIL